MGWPRVALWLKVSRGTPEGATSQPSEQYLVLLWGCWRVMVHPNQSWHTQMSHGTPKWVMAHLYESCHDCMRHVADSKRETHTSVTSQIRSHYLALRIACNSDAIQPHLAFAHISPKRVMNHVAHSKRVPQCFWRCHWARGTRAFAYLRTSTEFFSGFSTENHSVVSHPNECRVSFKWVHGRARSD